MDSQITEQNSVYDNLEKMNVDELAGYINAEDNKVAIAVNAALPGIIQLTEKVVEKLESGGRLFYIGAGTSGRLGILDASECPPTFGVPQGMVIGIIAGGDIAIRKSVEGAEDDINLGFEELMQFGVNVDDIVIGISASGRTPYVAGTLEKCRSNNITTGCIVSNPGSQIALLADFPVVVVTGPEFVTGSTRMKAGTAQKMVLNTITTTAMIKLGRIVGNKMVYLKPSNTKLKERMIRIVAERTGNTLEESEQLLEMHNYDLQEVLKHLK